MRGTFVTTCSYKKRVRNGFMFGLVLRGYYEKLGTISFSGVLTSTSKSSFKKHMQFHIWTRLKSLGTGLHYSCDQ